MIDWGSQICNLAKGKAQLAIARRVAERDGERERERAGADSHGEREGQMATRGDETMNGEGRRSDLH